METKPNPDGKNALWEFFSSVRLTILLLVLLATAAVVGTLVPQGDAAVDFARALSPQMLRVFVSLDIFDVYHSVWFRLLIGLLVLNLIVCSLDRFPRTWRRFRTVAAPNRPRMFNELPAEQCMTVPLKSGPVTETVEKHLRKRFRAVRSHTADGQAFFVVERGRFAHFGVYIVHLSVLVILAGGLFGSFGGLDAVLQLAPGEEKDRVFLEGSRTPHDLGFQVRCDRFAVEFYDNGTPREWRAELLFRAPDGTSRNASVRVNHPASFKGITFYQSGYGPLPGREVVIRVQHDSRPAAQAVHTLQPGQTRPLPATEGGEFRLLQVRPMGNLPAALISVSIPGEDERQIWLFQDFDILKKRLPAEMLESPKFDPAAVTPFVFTLMEQKQSYYTVLGVRRDPGVPVVWLGCFMMVGGLFVTFFLSHRRMWVRVAPAAEGARIEVAGHSSKNPVGLQREVERLTQNLQRLFEEG